MNKKQIQSHLNKGNVHRIKGASFVLNATQLLSNEETQTRYTSLLPVESITSGIEITNEFVLTPTHEGVNFT
jgi:hypothetical protein